MPDFSHIANIFLLIVVIILLRPHLRRWYKSLGKRWKKFKQRRWKLGMSADKPRVIPVVDDER